MRSYIWKQICKIYLFIKKLRNTIAELKNCIAYEKMRVHFQRVSFTFYFPLGFFL